MKMNGISCTFAAGSLTVASGDVIGPGWGVGTRAPCRWSLLVQDRSGVIEVSRGANAEQRAFEAKCRAAHSNNAATGTLQGSCRAFLGEYNPNLPLNHSNTGKKKDEQLCS
jgi:hypothetical protein